MCKSLFALRYEIKGFVEIFGAVLQAAHSHHGNF